MAMQKAIISTDVGDVSKFITNGHNGYITSVDDPADLARKICLLIERDDLRMLFGKEARKTAFDKLSLDIASKKHIEIYQNILSATFQ
jgi:glycosyltransferase involved in cell wall biosynthesis